jgi:hypothetical protein
MFHTNATDSDYPLAFSNFSCTRGVDMGSIHEAGHVRISKRLIKKIDKIPLELEGTLKNVAI